MNDTLRVKLEELEKRLEAVAEKMGAVKQAGEQALSLQKKVQELEGGLERSRLEKEESLKGEQTKLGELQSKARGLENELSREKRFRRDTANRIEVLIKGLEEVKLDD